MGMIKNICGGTSICCVFFIFVCFGSVNSVNDALTSDRIERAILGTDFNSRNDIVGGGSPGKDFPALNSIPKTDFSCHGRTPGFYADEEHGCQVFHRCHSDRRKDSFLCPNGTVFHQLRLVCDWWYNVDCASSDLHVSVNNEIGRVSAKGEDPQHTGQKKSSFTSVSDFSQTQKALPSPFADPRPSERGFSQNRVGIPLRGTSNFRDETADTANVRGSKPISSPKTQSFSTTRRRQENDIHSSPRVPLITNTGNRISPPITTLAPRLPSRLFSLPKPERTGIPLSNNINRNINENVSERKVLNGRRVTINKRPIATLHQDTRGEGPTTGVSLPHFRTPQSQSFRGGNRISTRPVVKPQKHDLNVNEQGVAILDDKKVTTQFFNIGTPQVVSNRIPTTSRVGRPLSSTNQQFSTGNTIRNGDQRHQDSSPPTGIKTGRVKTVKDNIGRPLPATNFQSARRKNTQNNIGRPLPATQPPRRTNTQNNIGRPLPATQSPRRTNTQNNIGRPVPVTQSPRRATTRNNIGRPLPVTQSPRRTSSRNNIGRPLPATQSPRRTSTQNNIGRPLPAVNLQLLRGGLTQNNIGRPLPATQFQSSRKQNPRNNVGRPLSTANVQSPRRGNTQNIITRPSSAPIQQPGSGTSRNVNRGTTTFQSSLKNRGSFNRLFNNRNQVSRLNAIQPASFVRDIDDLDDLLGNTDEIVDDPFDDDRFDLDDRFDDDRFDLDDRFDDDRFDLDDRFDDDRFDLDDRFDDDRFDLDDRFDDDRFDLDDRFDDDRFDLDDRFDDDRFDLDDRFDNDPFDDDRFDFDDDDDFDDRLNRFGNGANFNFDRITRGSTFSSRSDERFLPNSQKNNVKIKPPPEIQLPPPPL